MCDVRCVMYDVLGAVHLELIFVFLSHYFKIPIALNRRIHVYFSVLKTNSLNLYSFDILAHTKYCSRVYLMYLFRVVSILSISFD